MRRFYVKSKGTVYQLRDHRSTSLFFGTFYSLIISFLAFCCLPNFAKSQKTNVLVFEELVGNFVANHPKKIDSLSGFFTDELQRRIFLQQKASFDLNIEEPSVDFQALGKKQFQRKVATVLTYQDSTEHVYALTFCDTILGNQLGQIRQSEHPALRGTNPRWTSKILFPAAMIGTGIAGIIALFYFRSS